MNSQSYIRLISLSILMLINSLSIAKISKSEKDRSYLASMLKVFYIEYPNSKKTTKILIDNYEIQEGKMVGTFWEDQNNIGAQNLMKALLLPPEKGGDEHLQFLAKRIIQTKNKFVLVYILNDHYTDLLPLVEDKFGVSIKNGRAWQSGASMEKTDMMAAAREKCEGAEERPKLALLFAGFMGIGTSYLNQKSIKKTRTSFVHELSHTQDVNIWAEKSFFVENKSYVYGPDGSHWRREAIPSSSHAYVEGLANVYGYLYQKAKFSVQYKWFSRNGEMRVEIPYIDRTSKPGKEAQCMGAGLISRDIWMYEEIKNAKIPVIKTINESNPPSDYALFKIRDLPGKYLIHNETIVGMTIYSYIKATSLSRFPYILKDANRRIIRSHSATRFPELLHAMGKSHLPKGKKLDDLFYADEKDKTPQAYMMPLALLDYYTSYNAKTEDDLIKTVEYDANMQKWLALYWPHRDAIRKGIDRKNPKLSDLDKIAIHTGLKPAKSQ